jgi:hypothetical protein
VNEWASGQRSGVFLKHVNGEREQSVEGEGFQSALRHTDAENIKPHNAAFFNSSRLRSRRSVQRRARTAA